VPSWGLDDCDHCDDRDQSQTPPTHLDVATQHLLDGVGRAALVRSERRRGDSQVGQVENLVLDERH